MHASTRAFIKRGGSAAAAAAILLGGTFGAGAAMAAPASGPSAPETVATDPATPETVAAPVDQAALPPGLAEAVKKDLGLSVEEFNAQGALAAKAAEVQAEVAKADPAAAVSVAGDTINVKTSAANIARAAAGAAKVDVSEVQPAPMAAKVDPAGIDALFAAYTAKFGAGNLQSIMVNAAGEYVIRTGDVARGGPAAIAQRFTEAPHATADNFAASYTNVVIQAADGPVDAYADVTNGQGYVGIAGNMMSACSIGWNGFDASGKAAILSAGHCTGDGAAVVTGLTDPTKEPAVGGPGYVPTMLLGEFGASQFGGPGNSPALAPPGWDGNPNTAINIGTDVSVIDKIVPDVNQLAQVTDWTTPADPKASGPQVTGVSSVVAGTPICKSGRTTGWTCGTVTGVGAFLVAGINYPADENVCDPEENGGVTPPACDDIRAVRGFASTSLDGAPGDSGGSIIAGNSAVGMVSAGVPGVIAYGVDLKDALAHTAGYTVKISLEAPKVTTTAPVYREGAVTGTLALAPTAPAGAKVAVTIDGTTTEVPVGADGKWTAKAPNKFGTFPVTAQAKNGFSTSATTTASIEVIKETLPAPAITSPADGSSVAAPVTTISGTGKPGATVKLTGDVSGTTVVAGNGKWSFTLPSPLVELNFYDVAAMQTLTDWIDSPETTSGFTIAPNGPAIMSPANGAKFAYNKGPSAISGTNLAQATVHVTVNGKGYDAVVDGTTWSVTLDAPLGSGSYAITATQQWGDFASLTSKSAIVVQAEPKPEPTTAPTTQQPTPTTAAPTAAATTPASGGGNLANTGASGTTIILGSAGGLLLLGGVAFLLIRRRSSH